MKLHLLWMAVLVGLSVPTGMGQSELLIGAANAGPPPRNDPIASPADPIVDLGTTADVFKGTGADQCADATVVSVAVGPPRTPNTLVILGDNTPATGPDCDSVSQGAPMWWEAFEIDQEADVLVAMCGTDPGPSHRTRKLIAACPESGTACGADVAPSVRGQGYPHCGDDNLWMEFDALPAGTYYYPVFADETQLRDGLGPYQLTIAAAEPYVPCTDDCGGPDIVTGHVAILAGFQPYGVGLAQLGREGEIGVGTVGLGVDTTACNKGGEAARWFALPSTDHPVMAGNLYRLATVEGSDRMEQIGQSWVKHGFASGNTDECRFGCECPPGGCRYRWVEVGCSDTYNAGQFQPCGGGGPALMAQRSVIHPYTGAMPEGGPLGPGGGCQVNFPAANHIGHDHPPPDPGTLQEPGILHRLQVQDVELMPELNEGARYFSEGLYVHPSEYAEGNGNQNNNFSYRECAVEGPDQEGVFTFPMISTTFAEQPAIRAWPGASFSRIEPAPMSDGIAALAYEVTDLGGGTWHYEYILFNQNMDCSMGAFAVPLPDGVTVTNLGFHAPLNHAPETNAENYPNDPWIPTTDNGAVRWAIEPFDVEPLGNAVRWGTAYNFRFDADSPPMSVHAEVGLFKTGQSISVATLAPQPLGDQDCNTNGIEDTCDRDCSAAGCDVPGCGQSIDCDLTGVPDECEIDCNGNGIADSCDVRDGTDADCNINGVPDACEPDCDHNGTPDHCDLANGDLLDSNGDAVPDECEYGVPPPPACDPNDCWSMLEAGKNRYLSFSAKAPSSATAGASLELIRVTLVDVPQFPIFNGQKLWAGTPAAYADEDTSDPKRTFVAAELQCDMPDAADWSSFDLVNVYGAAIVPGSTYNVQQAYADCPTSLDDDACFSEALVVATGKWGDVAAPFGGDGQPDFTDIAALVDKFQALATAPPKARAQLQPDVVRQSFPIDFSDIAACIDAFTGQPYPFAGPTACP